MSTGFEFGLFFDSDVDSLKKGIDAAESSAEGLEGGLAALINQSEAFQGSLDTMSADAANAATVLSMFGQEEIETASKVKGIRELQDAFADLSDEDAADLGKQLGIDASFVAKLRQGEEGIEDLVQAMNELEEDTDDVAMSVDELITKFGGFVASALSVGAIAGAVISQAARTDELGKFSETLGLNIEDVYAWSEAVVRSGGDANSFQSSIQSLTGQLTDLNLTGAGPAAEVLARLGINARNATGNVKGAFQLLPELADSFQRLSKQEAFAFGQKLGLDQGTILLLQQGRRAVEDLVDRQRQLGVATQEDYEIAAKFNDQWADTQQVFASLAIATGSKLLPVFTDLLEGAEEMIFFLADHSELVVGFFAGAGVAITTLYLPAILSAAAATLATVAPFLAIGAAVAAFGAAVAIAWEDIQAFLSGQSSLIGDISEKYPAIGQLITRIADIVGSFVGTLSELGSALYSVFADEGEESIGIMDAALEALLFTVNTVSQGILKAFDAMAWIKDFLVNLFTDPTEALRMLQSLASDVVGNISGLFASIADSLPDFSGIADALADSMEQAFIEAINGLKALVQDLIDGAVGSLTEAAGDIADFFTFGDDETEVTTETNGGGFFGGLFGDDDEVTTAVNDPQVVENDEGGFFDGWFGGDDETQTVEVEPVAAQVVQVEAAPFAFEPPEAAEEEQVNQARFMNEMFTGVATNEPFIENGSEIEKENNEEISVLKNIDSGIKQMNAIDQNPLNTHTSQSIATDTRITRSNSVHVAQVNVQTQATDAQGMAEGAAKALNEQLQDAVNDFDDGVAI